MTPKGQTNYLPRETPLSDADAALLSRARAGDRDAFAALCERSRRRIWRVVSSVTRGGGGADTEDLAQEAIVRALRALPTFAGDSPAAFEAWLCRIALNAAHDYHKSAWRRRVLFWNASARTDGPADESGDPSGQFTAPVAPGAHEEAERRALQQRIRAAVAGLGAKERVPIYLIYFEEFRLADVARLEGVPESTIRSRVKTGLRRLERVLGDLRFPAADDADIGGSDDGDAAPPRTSATAAATATKTASLYVLREQKEIPI